MGGAIHRGPRGPATLIAALAVIATNPAWAAATAPDDDLASRFVTAPETAPDQQQLVEIEVNGVDFGIQPIRVSHGKVTLPPATVTALRIAGRPGQSLELTQASGITSRFNEARATLALTVPVGKLTAQRFAPEGDEAAVRLSPETWGVYVNYDVNLRHTLGSGSAGTSGTEPRARAPRVSAPGAASPTCGCWRPTWSAAPGGPTTARVPARRPWCGSTAR